MTTYRKKLIEVALPLEAINQGSKPETENPFLKGHPRAIHNWWARTPLSVSRAILFAQLIDDPGNDLPPDKAKPERDRLLEFVTRLSTWEATTDEELMGTARKMIAAQFKGKMPEFWDMFAGRASIPLEAQRLGLKVTSSDLNPVAITMQRALLEFPPAFLNRPPVHPKDNQHLVERATWTGTAGLADDIRWYGGMVCKEARKRLSKHYPPAPNRKVATAWVWARTVVSPNPAANGQHVPLISTYWLSNKKDNLIWLEPVVDRTAGRWHFQIRTGTPKDRATVSAGTKTGRGCKFKCLLTGEPIPEKHIKEESKAGRVKYSLLAIVAGVNRDRCFLPSDDIHVRAAFVEAPADVPSEALADDPRNIWCIGYGLERIDQLFTPRQLTSLVTICDVIADVRREIIKQTASSGNTNYADAISFYLACALSRMTDYHSNLATWNPTNENVRNLFQRQAIPMAWDFCEANPIEGKLAFDVAAEWVASSLESLPKEAEVARVMQLDARKAVPEFRTPPVVSTDPPYYDNISYAGLADFFYVWLRRALRSVDPKTFATLLTPKEPELIAQAARHGSEELAEKHFRDGFQSVFKNMLECAEASVPCTIYYAFKQEEEDTADNGEDQRVSTGWETMLEGLVDAGFQITGTWPVRTTKKARAVARGTNALASAVVLVARRRAGNSPIGTRKQLLAALKAELPGALVTLTQSSIAPVDLAQAMIGPGMAVFTQFVKVVESDGKSMSVRTALGLINQVLDEVLTEQEGEFDVDTRWALAWFDQFGLQEEVSGTADTLCRAKNTAINGLVEAGIIKTKGGKVRLLKRDELPDDWNPATDKRLTVWETTQQLIRTLETKGESEAATLLNQLGGMGETARDLAYRLHSVCTRKGWTDQALAYNGLVIAWPELSKLALSSRNRQSTTQQDLFT